VPETAEEEERSGAVGSSFVFESKRLRRVTGASAIATHAPVKRELVWT
jgi:hypothetical protein